MRISILALAALMAGCAQTVWLKPGASQDDFSRDRYGCMQESQQRVGGAVVNQFGGSATNTVVTNGQLFGSCMNSRGWYLTQRNQQTASAPSPSAAPNPIAASEAKVVQARAATCAKPEYQSILAKSPCKAEDISLVQLADESRISESEKAAFARLRAEGHETDKMGLAVYRAAGGPRGNKFADAVDASRAAFEQTALALYTGKVTWGEYNLRRKENSRALSEELRKIRTAAN